MTPLGREIARRIATDGPMTVADYMADCLTHPAHGYYVNRDPFGAGGDFITAPEISQMFGELLGLCLAQAWIDQGSPAPFVLAEAGPGRGTLMADVLRATAGVPGFHAAARLTLVEVSPELQRMQAERLRDAAPHWCADLSALPPGPLFLLANEFFDALPIRQFVRRPGGWSERVVAYVEGHLTFAQGPVTALAELSGRLDDTREGDVVETCRAARQGGSEIGARIARHGGAAIVIDYGGWRSLGDTLQAVRGHRPVDPLAEPGLADLTAHVDFEPIARAAAEAGAAHSRATPQGDFLDRLGIRQRAEILGRALTGEPLRQHLAASRRLTDPDEMGDQFRVMSIHPHDHPAPAGLDP